MIERVSFLSDKGALSEVSYSEERDATPLIHGKRTIRKCRVVAQRVFEQPCFARSAYVLESLLNVITIIEMCVFLHHERERIGSGSRIQLREIRS